MKNDPNLDLVPAPADIQREALLVLGKVNKLFAKRRMAVCSLVLSTLIAKYVKAQDAQYRETSLQTLLDNAFEVLKEIE